MSKEKVWLYHFAIVKYDKTVALHMLTMIESYLSLSHISGSNVPANNLRKSKRNKIRRIKTSCNSKYE